MYQGGGHLNTKKAAFFTKQSLPTRINLGIFLRHKVRNAKGLHENYCIYLLLSGRSVNVKVPTSVLAFALNLATLHKLLSLYLAVGNFWNTVKY